jgi:hypothetical protein
MTDGPRSPRPTGAGGPAETLRALLASAVRAPSRNNTQPWLFEIEGPEARVYADPRRALPEADPDGRELVIACAAALETLRVAAAAAGHATSIELVAAHAGGLVGRLRLEEPRAPEADDDALFAAVAARRTNRLGFDERPLPAGLVARLARDAAACGAALRPVEESARRAVAELVAEADATQWERPRFRAELAAWTRARAARASDGVPGTARGLGSAAALVDRVLLRVPGRGRPEARRDRQHLVHAPALLALATTGDAPGDWARAGLALGRVLLRAASEGLSASYYSAAIELPAYRARLRELLGELGFLQVLFRIGHGPPLPPTPRRRPEDVLRAFRTAAPATTALAPRG